MRSQKKRAPPRQEEAIIYNIPPFNPHGFLVCHPEKKEQIVFYQNPAVIHAFKKDLAEYKLSKGAIQFPLDQPLPHDLIARIVKYRIKENEHAIMIKMKK